MRIHDCTLILYLKPANNPASNNNTSTMANMTNALACATHQRARGRIGLRPACHTHQRDIKCNLIPHLLLHTSPIRPPTINKTSSAYIFAISGGGGRGVYRVYFGVIPGNKRIK